MYRPTMQCNSKTYYQMFQPSATCLTYVSLNRHGSVVLSMTVCWMLEEPSYRRINSIFINILPRITIDPQVPAPGWYWWGQNGRKGAHGEQASASL